MSRATPFIVVRNVTPEECDWLRETVYAGETVYRCTLPTYGCITSYGIAVTRVPDECPFFELPFDALSEAPAAHPGPHPET